MKAQPSISTTSLPEPHQAQQDKIGQRAAMLSLLTSPDEKQSWWPSLFRSHGIVLKRSQPYPGPSF